MSIDLESARSLAGSSGRVYDGLGNKIGTIGQVYVDDETGQPNWVTVRTELFGLAESFAPLDGDGLKGGDLYLLPGQFDVKGAPRIDPDGSLTPDGEQQLDRRCASSNAGAEHYVVGGGSTVDGAAPAAVSESDPATNQPPRRAETHRSTDRSTPKPIHRSPHDDARTEGEINGGRRLRLRKYVVTEEVSVTVPVQREKVRLEPEPSDDDPASTDGRAMGTKNEVNRESDQSDRTGR